MKNTAEEQGGALYYNFRRPHFQAIHLQIILQNMDQILQAMLLG
jgi:hypothetical protein